MYDSLKINQNKQKISQNNFRDKINKKNNEIINNLNLIHKNVDEASGEELKKTLGRINQEGFKMMKTEKKEPVKIKYKVLFVIPTNKNNNYYQNSYKINNKNNNEQDFNPRNNFRFLGPLIIKDNNYKYSNIQYKSNKKLEDSSYNSNTKKKLNLKKSCEHFSTKYSESISNSVKVNSDSNEYSKPPKFNKNNEKDDNSYEEEENTEIENNNDDNEDSEKFKDKDIEEFEDNDYDDE